MDWLHFSGNAEMDVKMSSIFQIMFLKMILKFVVTKIAKDDLWVRNCKSFLRRKAKKKSELWKPVIRLAEQYPPSFITATAKRSEWKVGRRQKKSEPRKLKNEEKSWMLKFDNDYFDGHDCFLSTINCSSFSWIFSKCPKVLLWDFWKNE